MTRHIILHHHIFKNAGSTLIRALQRSFPDGLADYDRVNGEPTALALGTYLRRHPNIKALTSHHFHTRPFHKLEGAEADSEFCFFHAVLLRHPIDRIVSMYRFYRAGGGAPCDERAQAMSLDFPAWVRYMIDYQPHQINDVQTTILAQYGRYVRPPSHQDLALAIDRLATFWLVGPTERFEEVCIAAEHFARPTFANISLASANQNVSRGPSIAQDGATIERLKAFNQLDLQLWRAAGDELDRRLAFVYDVESRKTDYRQRCIAV